MFDSNQTPKEHNSAKKAEGAVEHETFIAWQGELIALVKATASMIQRSRASIVKLDKILAKRGAEPFRGGIATGNRVERASSGASK